MAEVLVSMLACGVSEIYLGRCFLHFEGMSHMYSYWDIPIQDESYSVKEFALLT